MRQTLLTIIGAATFLAAPATDAAAKSEKRALPDMSLTVTGADLVGEAMAISCNLALVALPSNLFTGVCDVAIGGEHMIVTGLAQGPERALTVVLNGQITIRGSAVSGSARFGAVIRQSAAGFPVRIEIDPLTRRFTLASEAPGGSDEPLAAGRMTGGDILFAVQ